MPPLKTGSGEINKSSSDDRPGPGICDSKYPEDAKAARSVDGKPVGPDRPLEKGVGGIEIVWDRVPI